MPEQLSLPLSIPVQNCQAKPVVLKALTAIQRRALREGVELSPCN